MQDWVSECEREKRTSFKNKKNSDDIFGIKTLNLRL
jgi:hypothetical protein